MTLVRLKPTTPRSQVKYFTTEPLSSLLQKLADQDIQCVMQLMCCMICLTRELDKNKRDVSFYLLLEKTKQAFSKQAKAKFDPSSINGS